MRLQHRATRPAQSTTPEYRIVQCCDADVAIVDFFCNDPATTEIYTLFPTRRSSDLSQPKMSESRSRGVARSAPESKAVSARRDRKSTRLNSSHSQISYAVFCLKKKKQTARVIGHV